MRITRAARIIVLGALLLANFGLTDPSMAQESSRKLKTGPPPEYPPLARRLNITGTARVLLTIAPEGKVKEVKEVGGNPLLLKSLVDAVKSWKYESATTESTIEVKYDFR